MGDRRGAYGVLVGKPEGSRPLGRPRRRWENNIKMDFREVGWRDIDWIDLAQDRNRSVCPEESTGKVTEQAEDGPLFNCIDMMRLPPIVLFFVINR